MFAGLLMRALRVAARGRRLVSGCGYSLAGRGSFLPAYIKIIGVPLSLTAPGLRHRAEDHAKVRAELIGRGKYEVVPDRTGVDAVLLGDILAIGIAPVAFNEQQQATRYAVTLVAKVEFSDLKTNKVIWPNPQMVLARVRVTTTQTATDPNAFLGQTSTRWSVWPSEFARAVVSAILSLLSADHRITRADSCRSRHPLRSPQANRAAGKPDPVYLIVGDDEAEMSRLAADSAALVEDELRAFNVERIYADRRASTPAAIVEAARHAADDVRPPRRRRAARGEAAEAEAARQGAT